MFSCRRLEGCQFLQNDLRKLAKKLHHLHKVFRKSEEEMPEVTLACIVLTRIGSFSVTCRVN